MMGWSAGIFSCKGGVGKSLIAANLGAILARSSGKPTLVIDSNSVLGTMNVLLKAEPQYSWRDLFSVRKELSWNHIDIAVHNVWGHYYLLCAPDSDLSIPEKTAELSKLDELIAGLKMHFGHVILDGFSLQNYPGVPFDHLDWNLYVVTPDMLSMKSTSRYLQSLSSENQSAGVIINQWFPEAVFSPADVEKILGMPVLGVVPVDGRSAWRNINLGESVISGKNHKLKAAFLKLAQVLSAE
jgi:pilus assembly protein CpaE